MAVKVTQRNAESILRKLKKHYPVNYPLDIRVNLCPDFIDWDGRKLDGLMHRRANETLVNIYVNTNRDPDLVMHTLAHEYRHIMQKFNLDMEWMCTKSGKTDKETDAQLFGKMILRTWF